MHGLLWGILNYLFQCDDAADAYIQFVGAEALKGFSEAIGDLPSSRQLIIACGVNKGNARPDCGDNLD
jgi:hypothetical protein